MFLFLVNKKIIIRRVGEIENRRNLGFFHTTHSGHFIKPIQENRKYDTLFRRKDRQIGQDRY